MHANQQRNFSVIFSTGRNQRLNQLFLSFLLFCCMFCKHCHMEIETDLKYLHDFFIWDSLERKSFGVNIFVGKKSVEDTSELH